MASTSSTSGTNPFGFINNQQSGGSSVSSVANGSKTNAAGGVGTGATSSSADQIQNSFLTLLTAQLNAQDPLNPMDNAQITSQMAQISQVTGLQQLNQTMQAMVSAQAASQSLMAAGMVGKNVLVAGNQVAIPPAGASTQGGVMLNGPASAVTVSIKDANGTVVRTLSVPKPTTGMNTFDWDGKDSNGQPVPSNSTYTFSTEVTQASSGGSTTATAYNNQQVKAVSWVQGVPMLIMPDGSSVPLSNVAQLS
ncbi:flagellar hook capping protein [Xenophilus sp. AP218F]|nr:flagellar hook capping FlgD N-terminal domain-containing protein [Chromobacterium sp. ASV5]OWY37490.1 flagellar hook capping protein [Xenophilus sp. AP218F]